ncbi:MAG: hypothetical protein EOO82_01780 [Oxalobacteraceae bacterium]|nr:MAG: hypothetical protein EOO82_01780 [Oxalobacteraceae bacterium]
MWLPPYVSAFLALIFVAVLMMGFREGAMPGNSQLPWEVARNQNPFGFWAMTCVYAGAATFFGFLAISDRL